MKRVETQSGINILPLQPDGAPEQNVTEFSPGPGNGYGSVDGLYFNQDKVTVTAGQMADPAAPDQFMLTAAQAQSMGLHVGDKVRFGIYTNAQIQLADFGSARVRPYRVDRSHARGDRGLQLQRRAGPGRRGVGTGQPVHPGAYPAAAAMLRQLQRERGAGDQPPFRLRGAI